jgi:protein-L-isoaspartate(D-aspartate) O-methyltransferase
VRSDEQIRRDRMVQQLAERGITDGSVLEAMRAVPRERFVDEALRGKAYSDVSLPIGETQTISQPWIVARMSELLLPDGKGKVLEIGSGSGYQAAVLAHLFELVYSVERSAELSRRARQAVRTLGIEHVHFKIFDGSYGWSEFAPYRAVLVTAATPELPAPLLEQLEEGGRLILPLAPEGGGDQVLTRVVKRGGRLVQESHGPCRFVPLVGRYGMPA